MSFTTKLSIASLLNHGQSRGATATSSQAAAGPTHAPGAHSGNLQPPIPPMPVGDDALQKAIQAYISKLSNDDKAAFHSAPAIIDRLQEMQRKNKPGISSSLTNRIERVLQCIKHFMGSLGIFIQHSPELSSLAVGGLNCVMTVGTSSTYMLFT